MDKLHGVPLVIVSLRRQGMDFLFFGCFFSRVLTLAIYPKKVAFAGKKGYND